METGFVVLWCLHKASGQIDTGLVLILAQCQGVLQLIIKILYRVILSVLDPRKCEYLKDCSLDFEHAYTRVGTLIVATIYLQLIQNRYMFRSFTVLLCSHQHCLQPVASDVEVVGYI